MKSRTLLLYGMLMLPMASGAQAAGPAAPPDWSRLDVVRDSLQAIEAVNGVPLHITRFSGSDVALLLERWLGQWARDPRTLLQQAGRRGEWQLRARLASPGIHEVLQLRGIGAASELLWSWVELGVLPRQGRSLTRLPAGCRAGPTLAGRDSAGAFEVSPAVCDRTPAQTLGALAGTAATGPCAARSAVLSFCVLPLPRHEDGRGSAVVLLRSDPMAGRQ